MKAGISTALAVSLALVSAAAAEPAGRAHYPPLTASGKATAQCQSSMRGIGIPLDQEPTKRRGAFGMGDGQRHFRVEEEVLLPHWALDAEVDEEGVHRMLDDHLTIRREAFRLEAGEATLEEIGGESVGLASAGSAAGRAGERHAGPAGRPTGRACSSA